MNRTLMVDGRTLAEFLVEAKKSGWAGGAQAIGEPHGQRVGPLVRQFEKFQLSYVDRWSQFGSHLLGMETVSVLSEALDETCVWGMCYVGEDSVASPDEHVKINKVLRAALRAVPMDAPFRGPVRKVVGAYEYLNSSQGAVGNFSGQERVVHPASDRVVWQLEYFGKAALEVQITPPESA